LGEPPRRYGKPRSYLINTPAVFWAFAKHLEISIEKLTGIKIDNI
jgi:hypothetical protein